MVKRGGGRGKSKSITDLGDQATKDENKDKQEKELAKILTKEQNRKIKEIEKSLVAPPTPMSTRSKTASDRMKSEINIVKRRYDKKVIQEELNSIFDEITNMVSSVNVVDVVGNERLSGKPRHSAENVLLACSTPRSTKQKSFQLSDLGQVSNKKTATRTRRNAVASKPMEVLALENKKDTKSTSTVDKSLARSQYSEETDEVELNTDNKSSEEEQDPSLAKEKNYIELKLNGIQETSLLQNTKELDERQRNLDKPSKIKHEVSLEKRNKSLETKFSVNELSPILNFVQDIDERKLNLRSWKLKQNESSAIQKESESECNINKFTTVSQCSKDIDGQKLNSQAWNLQQKQSAEIEKNELKCEENIFTSVLQCSEDIDDQKLNLNLKSFKVQEELPLKYEKEIAKAKSKVDQSKLDFKVQEAKENVQNIDRNTSITPKEDVSSEEIKSFEPKNKQQEEIMNLREDANLCFEFDTNNVTVLVDNKDRYSTDKNRNMIFKIGDENIQLSLIDNKVYINSQRGKIDCSIRRNQIIFSVTDSLLQSDTTPENPSMNNLSLMKDAEIPKDLRSTNVTETAKMSSLDQSEEMDEKREYVNVYKSTLKANWLPKTLVAKSLVQQRILNVTENFLARIAASCKDFEIEFLDSLKKGNNK